MKHTRLGEFNIKRLGLAEVESEAVLAGGVTSAEFEAYQEQEEQLAAQTKRLRTHHRQERE